MAYLWMFTLWRSWRSFLIYLFYLLRVSFFFLSSFSSRWARKRNTNKQKGGNFLYKKDNYDRRVFVVFSLRQPFFDSNEMQPLPLSVSRQRVITGAKRRNEIPAFHCHFLFFWFSR
uniref:Uncharacterized protein n=1 Tax=Daphnia magna TaxID=35525 RepID=A0A0P4X6L3_9CRUS